MALIFYTIYILLPAYVSATESAQFFIRRCESEWVEDDEESKLGDISPGSGARLLSPSKVAKARRYATALMALASLHTCGGLSARYIAPLNPRKVRR